MLHRVTENELVRAPKETIGEQKKEGGGGPVIDSTMGDDAYIGVGLNDCHTHDRHYNTRDEKPQLQP